MTLLTVSFIISNQNPLKPAKGLYVAGIEKAEKKAEQINYSPTCTNYIMCRAQWKLRTQRPLQGKKKCFKDTKIQTYFPLKILYYL